MKKILFFAKILSGEIRKVYEVFYYVNYRLLDFAPDYAMCSGTKLRMKNNQYVILEELQEDMNYNDLLLEVRTEDCEIRLEEYVDDGKAEKIIGILYPNTFLYEILYDFGMLGDKFKDEKMDEAVEELIRTVTKVANAFYYNLHFLNGYIYITNEVKPLDEDNYVCENMAEVNAVCKLKEGASLWDTREASGMSKEEFDNFMKRLKRHK